MTKRCSPVTAPAHTNPICLIISCGADRKNGREAVCRETWLSHGGLDYKFMLGNVDGRPGSDQIFVDCPDDYHGLWQKQHAGYAWALSKGYSHVFICCTDTYVHIPRLLASAFNEHPYVGRQCAGEIYASGGAGYWLSASAIRAMREAGQRDLHTHPYPDALDGHLLASLGILLHEDTRYWGHLPSDLPGDFISVHLSRGTGVFDPEWMRAIHAKE